ncbi:MAG: serine hydrolase [Bacteroidales bacterium]
MNTYPAVSRQIRNLPAGYSNLPAMFHMAEKVVNEGIYAFNPQMEWTGGGIASTTSDLARWAKVYYGGSLVSDTLFNLIITPNSQAPLEEGGEGYGLGSFIYDTRHGIAYGHTGFVPGFNSIFAYFPGSGIAIALQSNCDYAAGNTGLMEYLCLILDCLEKNNQL